MQTAVLSLYRFDSRLARLWVVVQMGFARWPLARIKGLRFFKLCGSGTGEGFTPRPNTAVWAILTVWDDAESARRGMAAHAPFGRWAGRASETYHLWLEPRSARGVWSGQAPFVPQTGTAEDGPVAALTRATLRMGRAARFWGRVPDISARIGTDPSVMFKIGLGEVPLIHQVTFSVWPDTASMAAFARTGAHAEAIRAVRDEGWFSEELYARFRVIRTQGTWGGRNPLAPQDTRAA